MDFLDAVSSLLGKRSAESTGIQQPTNVHLVTMEAVEASSNGTVLVDPGGDVISSDDSQYVEIQTVGSVQEGDEIAVALVGEPGGAMDVMAIGTVGEGDRQDAAIDDAATTATDYITEISSDGIFVHTTDSSDPTDSSAQGVHISDSVDIVRNGVSVAEYGETARVGAESSGHVTIDADELMFHDGTNAVMQVGGSCQITEKHVCGSSTSEVFYLSLEPSNGARFRVIDNGGEIVTSNYTLSRSEKRCTLTNKSGNALDGETVLVFYQSSGMVLYDEGDVSSTFTTDQASLAGGMFEMSYEDTYSSSDGTVTDSTAEISIGKHRDQYSSISLNATPPDNRSYVTFQAKGNGYAAFVLDSGSTDDPERVLDLIYLDRINYADPYGGSDLQLGKPTRYYFDETISRVTANTDMKGSGHSIPAGTYLFIIDATVAAASSGSSVRRVACGLYQGSSVITYRSHFMGNSSVVRIECTQVVVLTSTTTMYGYLRSSVAAGSSSMRITALRIA